jgi:hypothetical protein
MIVVKLGVTSPRSAGFWPEGKSSMKVAPRLLLAMLALLGIAGCRTASTGSMAHTRPPEMRPRPTFDIDAFVAHHNENAERIRSLEARPSIGAQIGPPGKAEAGGVDGRLALERPRNFKLELYHFKSTVADIGSNDDRFWFWFQNKKDKSVYVCDYVDLSSTSLAVTYQPDWIAEALGLKTITPDEAAQIKTKPGTQPGTTVLSFPATRAGSQSYSRLMIVSDQTLKVNDFRVFAPDGKTLIAQATIKKYRELPIPESAGSADRTPQRCSIPENIILEWKREQLLLDVVLKDVKINQFDEGRRTALFVEPTPSGYARVNLAEVARTKESVSSTAVRETMPAPEPRNRARLGPPLQIKGENDAKASRKPEPADTRTVLFVPALDLDVIGAPVPTAPGERTGGAALAISPAPSMER